MHLTERRYRNTTPGDRPAQKLVSDRSNDIAITNAMTEAGVAALCESNAELEPYWHIVSEIYRAMEQNRRASKPS
jgi:hypothetical protein